MKTLRQILRFKKNCASGLEEEVMEIGDRNERERERERERDVEMMEYRIAVIQ